MNKQTTSHILMIEPVGFHFNPETAINNYFQERSEKPRSEVQDLAHQQFIEMVEKLRAHGVNVWVVKDTEIPHTPDSIFPNNWISTHEDGTVGLYPMFAENRRAERREDILTFLEENGFEIDQVVDYSSAEEDEIFLEGTGSLILDRVNRKAYAAISPRTDEQLCIEFCEDFEYTPVIFEANQTVENERLPIYHTNVMMCVADKYAVICLDTLDNASEKKQVVESLQKDGKEIITITEKQMHQFAGNMLQVENAKGEPILVMSQAAYDSLTQEQINKLSSYNNILPVDISRIEQSGGGSARCMMAEIFLPRKD